MQYFNFVPILAETVEHMQKHELQFLSEYLLLFNYLHFLTQNYIWSVICIEQTNAQIYGILLT
jgi:hypothetical protein